eukprot:Clim_evm3s191 gene=Clim_evmTU3s191
MLGHCDNHEHVEQTLFGKNNVCIHRGHEHVPGYLAISSLSCLPDGNESDSRSKNVIFLTWIPNANLASSSTDSPVHSPAPAEPFIEKIGRPGSELKIKVENIRAVYVSSQSRDKGSNCTTGIALLLLKGAGQSPPMHFHKPGLDSFLEYFAEIVGLRASIKTKGLYLAGRARRSFGSSNSSGGRDSPKSLTRSSMGGMGGHSKSRGLLEPKDLDRPRSVGSPLQQSMSRGAANEAPSFFDTFNNALESGTNFIRKLSNTSRGSNGGHEEEKYVGIEILLRRYYSGLSSEREDKRPVYIPITRPMTDQAPLGPVNPDEWCAIFQATGHSPQDGEYSKGHELYKQLTRRAEKILDDHYGLDITVTSDEDLIESVTRIKSDVRRLDLTGFQGDPQIIRHKIQTGLIMYFLMQKSVFYVQGMADIYAIHHLGCKDDSHSNEAVFWCFVGHMSREAQLFVDDQTTMNQLIDTFRILIQILDPGFYSHLEKHDGLHLFFCYRWFLLSFKREFAVQECAHAWMTIWRSTAGEYFKCLIAFAIIHSYRDVVLDQKMDVDDTLEFLGALSTKLDFRTVMMKARSLKTLLEKQHYLPGELKVFGNKENEQLE